MAVASETQDAARTGIGARGRSITVGLGILLLLLTGCSSGDGPAEDAQPVSAIVTAVPTEVAGDEATERQPEGRTINRFSLETGMCFNDYTEVDAETGETREFTTEVNCRRPHDGEVYAVHGHPADASTPFPGASEMERWAVERCYDDFESFVGTAYELSRLEIGVVKPTEETWSDPVGLHRTVQCYVRAAQGAFLSGSMRGSGI